MTSDNTTPSQNTACVVAVGSAVAWPTVEILAVLHAMLTDPNQWHRTSDLGQRIGLSTTAVYRVLSGLVGWGWVMRGQHITITRGRRGQYWAYALTIAGEPHARTLVNDPAGSIPPISAQQRDQHTGNPLRFTRHGLAVLQVLATDPKQRWTLPDLEHRSAQAAGLSARYTRAELSKCLWRGWLTAQPTDDRMVYTLTDDGQHHAHQYAQTLTVTDPAPSEAKTTTPTRKGTGRTSH